MRPWIKFWDQSEFFFGPSSIVFKESQGGCVKKISWGLGSPWGLLAPASSGLSQNHPPDETILKHSVSSGERGVGGGKNGEQNKWEKSWIAVLKPPPRELATLSAPPKAAKLLICISKQATDDFKVSTPMRPDSGMDLCVCPCVYCFILKEYLCFILKMWDCLESQIYRWR